MILEPRFREKLVQAMAEAHLTNTELANKMGVSRQYVGEYLSGRRSPGLDVLERFAAALEVDPWNLIDDQPLKFLTTNV